ncbi:helix-turn-helix transcriptional regulator [Arthrobacter echini]|uniref:Helix-turn-helix transcriptional regulator n=1 Tax=Arthrobacter echini TaxID=1529066 RepID=A0A5D0XLM6_9MICC|nr:helix-turn-helix transcriptional regulator [Arthrobacter echini]TYC96841.1 helix-turn-helix transcriptional regulator [Arthrobacter echini]
MRNRLIDLRLEAGLSQADLGSLLHVSRQTIIAIEKGKYDPALPLAFRIAKYFNLLIEDVFFPED